MEMLPTFVTQVTISLNTKLIRKFIQLILQKDTSLVQ